MNRTQGEGGYCGTRLPTPESGAFVRTEESLQIQPSAYGPLLRNRDFLRLWASQMVSAMGDWIIVAVLFAFVDQLAGGKSYAISLMMLAKFLPAVLLGFLAGVFIDRLDRKATLIICDLARALLVILLPFSPHLAVVCLLVFVIETFTIIYGPAKDASLPDLVPPGQLLTANSLNMLTLYASMAFGTALAGTIISFLGYLGRVNPGFFGRVDPNKAAFFVDSLTFITSAYLVFRITGFRKMERRERSGGRRGQVRRDFSEGIRYLWGYPLTRVVLLMALVCFLGGGTVYVLAVGFVKYVMGGGDAGFMYVLTVLLFGMMTGSVLAGILRKRLRKERVVGLATSGFGLGVVIFSLVVARWASFPVVFLGGTCMGYATVGMITLLHENLGEEFRGRAFATLQVVMRASIFVSIILAGPLADLITALGRRMGLRSVSFLIFRLGGVFRGELDGRYVDFAYLLNGPQVILLAGGSLIFAAGLFGHRSFRHMFAGEGKKMTGSCPWAAGFLEAPSGAGNLPGEGSSPRMGAGGDSLPGKYAGDGEAETHR